MNLVERIWAIHQQQHVDDGSNRTWNNLLYQEHSNKCNKKWNQNVTILTCTVYGIHVRFSCCQSIFFSCNFIKRSELMSYIFLVPGLTEYFCGNEMRDFTSLPVLYIAKSSANWPEFALFTNDGRSFTIILNKTGDKHEP
uniref:uncharacterized protein LOC120338008 n=1 Tax=Styela clava TaxID=7725 RepID=UPI0019394874|nr:uncharacterized protein LOC120338008 [Styela clava]